MGNGGSKGGGSGNSGNDPCRNRNVAGYQDANTGRNVICINKHSSYPSAHSNSKGGEGGYKGSQTAQASHGSFSNVKSLQAFENSFDNTGIMNCEGSSPHNINELSSLINIRGTMQPSWGANVFAKVKILNLSHSNLSGTQLSPLFQSMYYQKMDMDLLDLSFNKMCDNSVGEMLWSIGNEAGKQIHSIRCLKINNNEFSDKSAEYFTWHLNSGSLKYTKVLDVSGNQITKTGEGYLVKALLDKATQHMIIYTQKLEQNSKLLPGVGTKEEKIAMYREYLKQGIEKGTNNQAIVVDKSFWGKIKHTGNQLDTARIGIGGFIKCNWQPDEVIESYAQEAFTATISKTLSKILGKLNVVDGVVSCYLKAVDEMYTSVPGQKVVTHKLFELEGNHELQVIGESEFCSE